MSDAKPVPNPTPAAPLAVDVVNDEPLTESDKVGPGIPPPGMTTKGGGVTLQPTTTEQQDIVTAGQRQVSLIWENTQSRIAQLVVVSGVLVNSVVIIFIIFFDKEVSVTQLALISISLQFINLTVGIVIGFYFSRVNHQAIGGVGPKADDYQPYRGR